MYLFPTSLRNQVIASVWLFSLNKLLICHCKDNQNIDKVLHRIKYYIRKIVTFLPVSGNKNTKKHPEPKRFFELTK